MNIINILLLLLTITLSVFRNMLSKNISQIKFSNRSFFLLQSCIFASGAISLILFCDKLIPSKETICIAVIYAIFLMSAQWCYTIALSTIKLSVCSTLYSLGFIIPTLLGSLLWHEGFSIYDFLGTALIVFTIIISGKGKGKENKTTENSRKKHFVFLIIAMFSSGMLGFIQKIQQSIPKSCDERGMFVAIAFFVASLISIAFYAIKKGNSNELCNRKTILFSLIIGIAFGSCNLLNTTLAGRLKSSTFFPVQNISVIILSIILARFINKERFEKKEFTIFTLGALSILLICIL